MHQMLSEPQINPARSKSARRSAGRMSYARFLKIEGEKRDLEWVKGEVIEMVPVSDAHEDLRGFLATAITAFVDAKNLGVVRCDPFQMKTGPDLPGRAPDILFVAKKNLSRLKKNHLAGPADLVVEIISPGSGATDRGDKFDEYEQGGVREYWLIDPAREEVQFYQRRRGMFRKVPAADDGIYRCAAIGGIWLKVKWLWPKSRPKVLDVLRAWKLL